MMERRGSWRRRGVGWGEEGGKGKFLAKQERQFIAGNALSPLEVENKWGPLRRGAIRFFDR